MDGYLGQIMAWGPNWAPRNWAFCNGGLISIEQNPSLFSLIGTMYGGDGRTTFGLPNLQGRVAVGAGRGVGLTPRSQGQFGGAESVTLNTAQMPAHNHTATASGAGSASANLPLSQTEAVRETPNAGDVLATPSLEIYGPNTNTVDTPLPVTSGGETVVIGDTGGSQPHDNMQPFQVVSYIICIEGLYPSRS
ncbi:MAG: phage tail protein [Roseivirga sp.]|nr:phage tail protein [Roseivirga sp.]